jgi:hypothetical protein
MAAAIALAGLGVAGRASSQAPEYVDENGSRYQITRRVVPTTVPVQKVQEQPVTTYRTQVATENLQHQQVYSVPVTQYQVVPRLHGRWNPFVTPYWTYQYEPVTTWQRQVATVQIPVTRTALVPETRTVQQYVTTWETRNSEIVAKTYVGPTPTAGSPSIGLAARPLPNAPPSAQLSTPPSSATAVAAQQYGGQAMQNDPPKSPATWQPVQGGVPSTATVNSGSRY